MNVWNHVPETDVEAPRAKACGIPIRLVMRPRARWRAFTDSLRLLKLKPLRPHSCVHLCVFSHKGTYRRIPRLNSCFPPSGGTHRAVVGTTQTPFAHSPAMHTHRVRYRPPPRVTVRHAQIRPTQHALRKIKRCFPSGSLAVPREITRRDHTAHIRVVILGTSSLRALVRTRNSTVQERGCCYATAWKFHSPEDGSEPESTSDAWFNSRVQLPRMRRPWFITSPALSRPQRPRAAQRVPGGSRVPDPARVVFVATQRVRAGPLNLGRNEEGHLFIHPEGIDGLLDAVA